MLSHVLSDDNTVCPACGQTYEDKKRIISHRFMQADPPHLIQIVQLPYITMLLHFDLSLVCRYYLSHSNLHLSSGFALPFI